MRRFFDTQSRSMRISSVLLICLLLVDAINPATLLAQSIGPGQADNNVYSPTGASEMVDLFTGDFSYSIPIMDVDGFPISLSYNGDVKMDQDASWVGLGWALNAGNLSRQVRGLPDDFKGDSITEVLHLRDLEDEASEVGAELEVAVPITQAIDQLISVLTLGLTTGVPKVETLLSISAGLNTKASVNMGQHSYNGDYIDLNFDAGLNLSYTLLPYGPVSVGIIKGGGLGLSLSSRSGIGLNPSVSTGGRAGFMVVPTIGYSQTSVNSLSAAFTTRAGLQQIGVTQSQNRSIAHPLASASMGKSGTSYILPGTSSYTPFTPSSRRSYGSNSISKKGQMIITAYVSLYGVDNATSFKDIVLNQERKNAGFGFLHHQDVSYDTEAEDQVMDFNRGLNAFHVPQTVPNLAYAYQTNDIYSATAPGLSHIFRPFRNDVGHVFDPLRTIEGSSDTEFLKISRSKMGQRVGRKTGAAISALGNQVFDVPPFIDNFIKEGGFYIPVKYEYGNGTGTKMNRFGLWSTADGNTASKFRRSIDELETPEYEPTFFKALGETTCAESQLFLDNLEFEPIAGSLKIESVTDVITDKTIKISSPGLSGVETDRRERNTHISYLDAEHANFYALEQSIESYSLNNSTKTFTVSSWGRTSGNYKAHHISEFSVLSNGSRYVFGIPNYSGGSKEVSFNVGEATALIPSIEPDSCSSLVEYTPGVDNSISNIRGKDHYFRSVETPAHTEGNLLTAVLSPDYVDKTGDGPSLDDLGYYTKINYTRVHDDYRWRYPYSAESPTSGLGDGYPQAAFSKGFENSESDNRASYLYGEKEIWYIHSIETKNRVALFFLSERVDGFGVAGENGGRDESKALMKLMKIELHDRKELEEKGNLSVPLKTANFEYDYSLCEGNPTNSAGIDPDGFTNQTGKLTLKKFYFTYGSSSKGRLSPYEFSYGSNFDYQNGAVDRWGNYMPQQCSVISNQEYPYSEQDTALANSYARAWKLTTVMLPSGGQINVQYEADQYAYVQDAQVAQMFQIQGFGRDEDFVDDDMLFDFSSGGSTQSFLPNEYMYVELKEPVASGANDDVFKDEYIGNLEFLYFKARLKVTPDGEYETVPGYAEIEDAGYCTAVGGLHTHGWIKIKTVPIQDENENLPDLPPFVMAVLPNGSAGQDLVAHPMSKAGWQLVRKNLQDILYPQLNCNSANTSSSALGFIAGFSNSSNPLSLSNPFKFVSVFQCLKQYLQSSFGLDWAALTQGGLNVAFFKKGYSYRADLEKSFVKLYEPEGRKLGGNYRVAKITATDGWSSMGGDSDQVYGQTYSYDIVDENDEIISSGVATSEPKIGGDDSPLHVPKFYDVENLLFPDDHHYVDELPGEDLFPAPNVGYRRVEVKNLERENVTRTATGHMVYEFFTAKDFPIYYDETLKNEEVLTIEPGTGISGLDGLLGHSSKDNLTMDFFGATQGYVLVLNDMHGKPKARTIFNETGIAKNSVRYSYYEDSNGWKNDKPRLKNRVVTFDATSNKHSNILLGQDYDYTVDVRKSNESSRSRLKSTSLNISLSFGFGHNNHSERIEREFASMVGLKVVQKYGILRKTEVKDGSSTIHAENIAFDQNTGQPVLVKVSNDYGDWVYDFSYPAYWMHKGMSGAWANQGIEVADGAAVVIDATGKVSNDYKQYFYPGDEVAVRDLGTMSLFADRHWIVKNEQNNDYYLVDRDGAIPSFVSSGSRSYKVLRSGRRNVQFASAGQLSSKYLPGDYVDVQDSVINAFAQRYSDHWQMYGAKDEAFATAPLSSPDLNDLVQFLNALYANGDIGIDPSTSPGSISEDISLAGYPYYPIFDAAFSNWQTCSPIVLRVSSTDDGTELTKAYELYCTSTSNNFVLGTDLTTADFPSGQTHDSISHFSDAVLVGMCGGPNNCNYDVKVHFMNGDTVTVTMYEVSFDPETPCFAGESFCGPAEGDTINPYVEGVRGNWRSKESFVYYSDEQRKTKSTVETRRDGMFEYARFWRYYSGAWRAIDQSSHPQNEVVGVPQDWIKVNDVTRCDPYGNALESRDALGLYAANVYGYNYTAATASAVNAEYRQLAFDGFEDYDYYTDACDISHFSFYPHQALVSGAFAHTGRYSMALAAGDSVSVLRSLTPQVLVSNNPQIPFQIRRNELIGGFSPHTTLGMPEKYVVSYWVKEGASPGTNETYSSKIELEIDCEWIVPVSSQRSNIIDGWQRVEDIYEIPAGALQYIRIELQNKDDTEIAYFDDVRIHPFRASMQSMVYEPNTMRLQAVLDDRNYATFYEYDREGKLVIVKKETERGIFTLNEVRKGIKK